MLATPDLLQPPPTQAYCVTDTDQSCGTGTPCTMTILSMTQAAQQAGISRSTLYRAIRQGRLSVTKQASGTRGIDTAELLRVFGPLQADTSQVIHSRTSSNITVLQERCAMLEQQVEWLRAELADAKDEKKQLLRVLETRLLEGPKRKRKKKSR